MTSTVTVKKTSSPNIVLMNAVLILTCFIAGKFGILLAVPPGYATPIWPPSGVALAALLVFGNRCLPGIFVGSFLVFTFVTHQITTDVASGMTIAAAIALGSTLQAAFGALLIRRFVGFPTSLDGPLSIIYFFVLSAVIACVVAPTIGVTVLWLNHKLSADDCVWNLFTWWFGDGLGVITITPLILVWLGKPREDWVSRRYSITLPTVLLFTLVVVMHVFVLKLDKERIQNDFEDYSKRLGSTVANSIELNLRMAEAVGDFYNSSQFVERDEFREFTTRILKTYSFESLAWVPVVGEGDNEVKDGIVGLAAWRGVHYPVVYVEPQDKYNELLGYDIGSSPKIKEALDKARLTHTTAIAEVDSVVPFFTQNGTRLISVYPVFNKASEIMGYVVGLINFEKFINHILSENSWSSATLGIADVTQTHQQHFLFTPPDDPNVLAARSVKWQEIIPVADRLWRVDFWPEADFVRKRQSWFVWGFLAGAMLFVSLVEISLLMFSGNSLRIERLVRDRTRELKQTQEQLFQSQKLESLGKLAGGIAHDYNNILASIMGFGSMLRQRVGHDEKSVIQADIIISSAERAAKLTQQLLGFARKGQYERKIFSLNDSVKQTVDILSATVTKNIDIRTNLEADLATIEGDSNQIMQVLLNLGLNARDAMPQGGTITIETQNYLVKEGSPAELNRDKHHYVLLKFSDTGTGIDLSVRDKIFDPFFTTKPQGKGTGLGLAMVYGIVKNHGGIIDIESELGEGTTFLLYFPANQ